MNTFFLKDSFFYTQYQPLFLRVNFVTNLMCSLQKILICI